MRDFLRTEAPEEYSRGSRPAEATHCRTSRPAASRLSSASRAMALVAAIPGMLSSCSKRSSRSGEERIAGDERERLASQPGQGAQVQGGGPIQNTGC